MTPPTATRYPVLTHVLTADEQYLRLHLAPLPVTEITREDRAITFCGKAATYPTWRVSTKHETLMLGNARNPDGSPRWCNACVTKAQAWQR